MSSSDPKELVPLMSYAEISEYLTNTPEVEIDRAQQKLESLDRESTARQLAGMKQIAELLRDLNEENLDEVLVRLDRHNEYEQDWAFLELGHDRHKEELESELTELKEIKQTPWAKTRELNDRYNLLGSTALNAAILCNQVSEIAKYKETATRAGQLFAVTAFAVDQSRKLPKEAPKHRDQIKANYEEAWTLLQKLIDNGLDTVAYGYGTLEQRIQNRFEQHRSSEEETVLPF